MRIILTLSVVIMGILMRPVNAQWPEVTIHDIQYVANPDEGNDHSPFEGDTVVVEGVAMGHARSLWAGARWSLLIADSDGQSGPWSGLHIIQHDTTGDAAGTGVGSVQEGDVWKFTGIVEEFSYVPTIRAQTEVAILTDPLVPVQYMGTAILPDPEIVTCQDLSTISTGEQWEEVLVRIEGCTMVNNDIGSNQALILDDTGYQMVVEDWYNSLRDSLTSGLYGWPPNGYQFNITGFVRDLVTGTGYAIAPRSSGDIELIWIAPMTLSIRLEYPSNATLSWDSVYGATAYDIYRSTQAFFTSEEIPWMSVAAPASNIQFSAGIGDVETNYYFLGIAKRGLLESDDSNIVGENDFETDIP